LRFRISSNRERFSSLIPPDERTRREICEIVAFEPVGPIATRCFNRPRGIRAH